MPSIKMSEKYRKNDLTNESNQIRLLNTTSDPKQTRETNHQINTINRSTFNETDWNINTSADRNNMITP